MAHFSAPIQALNVNSYSPRLKRWLKASQQQARRYQQTLADNLFATQIPKLAQQTCELYLGDDSEVSSTRCCEILQMRVTLSPQQLKNFFETQIGRAILTRLSALIRWPADAASQANLHKTLLQILLSTDTFSMMSWLYQLSRKLQLNPEQLLITAKQVDLLLETTDSLLSTLETLSDQEAQASAWTPPAADDPRLPGAAGIEQSTFRIQSRQRTEGDGQKRSREFQVLLYTPTPWLLTPTPVIIISHGLGGQPSDLSSYAEHLASHGYLVAVPQHPGSDATQMHHLLTGQVTEVFARNEFIDRPLDVSDVLNELERRNQTTYEGRLNLTTVGVMGQSFGGYTALALAGATIDFENLEQACHPELETPNVSMLLQCRALDLPQPQQRLQDPRVKAILALDPIGRNLLGNQGMAKVTVPVLMVTGSADQAAPMALEPLQLFPGLGSCDRYLAVIKGMSHIHNFDKLLSTLKLTLLQKRPAVKLQPPIIDSYLRGLSLAFFDPYLRGISAAWLTAGYGRTISRSPYDLYLITQQSSQALEAPLQHFQAQLSELRWQTITVQHNEGLFNAAAGFSLYYQSWLPTVSLDAIVVILHGLGGHSGLFGNVVKALTPNNYGVFSFDLRGHGRSPGQRGYLNHWQEYREDVAHFLTMVQEQHPHTPCFLMGHSLGGIIALDYALNSPQPLAGLILTAPPFGTHSLTGLRLCLGQALSRLWPRFSLSTGLKHVPPSHERAVIIAYAHDPLRHCQGTARLATEYLATIRRLRTQSPALQVPLLMMHGEADAVALFDQSRAFFESIPHPDKTFRPYAGAYHELHDDRCRDQAMADLIRWLKEHLEHP